MHRLICFTSDLGLSDTWVGTCHAVIYRSCPQARVVDLAHDIPPFDIRKGASVAAAGVWQIPDAIHLVVVDPGVGGGRHDLVIMTGRGSILVGPDNGVLAPAARRAGGIERVCVIDQSHLDFQPPLATFHARDVLAPAAALLACGVSLDTIGHTIDADEIVPGPFPPAHAEGDAMAAEVVDLDRFGSVRIGITAEEASERGLAEGRLLVRVGHASVEAPFGRSFSDVSEGRPVALIDSSGWLTLAVRLGSAGGAYGIEPGMVARVSRVE